MIVGGLEGGVQGWQPKEAAPIVAYFKNQVLLKHRKIPK
jgi:hypothetical protein